MAGKKMLKLEILKNKTMTKLHHDLKIKNHNYNVYYTPDCLIDSH